jgi:hypothetical protein
MRGKRSERKRGGRSSSKKERGKVSQRLKEESTR